MTVALLTVAFFSIFYFFGSRHSDSVTNHAENFPRLEDKQCVDDAVEKTPGVKYVSSKTTGETARTPKGLEVRLKDHVIEYRFNDAKPFETGKLTIHESTSDDEKANFITLENISVSPGDKPSGAEVENVHSLMKAINGKIQESCSLKDFNSYFLD